MQVMEETISGAIVRAGPSGLVAARDLALKGYKIASIIAEDLK